MTVIDTDEEANARYRARIATLPRVKVWRVIAICLSLLPLVAVAAQFLAR